ncbi:rod shape-determining protein MreC [Sporanaerobium hydrogeniformans]|uniref:rod shape-determining protein MreC n=1 Tax=Sporanaerobium hydrogeniformans TaxID=3072179 RepID=UPI0015D50787|nr:rod shape-determining protein MreC [Sporanaerobium hydrogeniformans]
MKLTKKIKKVGIVISSILLIVIFLGKRYNIPVVSTGVNSLLYPFEKAFFYATQKVQGVTDYFKNVDVLLKENKALKEENQKLSYENSILVQYKSENNSLKSLLEMKQLYRDYEGLGANVIAKDNGNWYKTFKIDKGLNQGITYNGVILANGGLVGRVSEVDLFSSKVLTIIDDRSSVSAKIVRTGDTGILRGDIEMTAEGLCKLEINVESEVVKGDQVVTSHLSSIYYPTGIPIGTVEEIVPGKNGLTQYAYVRPIVDFKHLEQVLVLLNQEQ